MDVMPVTIEAFIKFVKGSENITSQDSKGSAMLAELEQTLRTLKAHPQYADEPESALIQDVVSDSVTLPLYDDGIEEQLTRTLTEKFGIASQKEFNGIAYFLCGVRLAHRKADVRQILQTQYDVKDQSDLQDLVYMIDDELRWKYNGDVTRFFNDLEKTPKTDSGFVKDRVEALNSKNFQEHLAGTSSLPEPKMM